MLAKFLHNHDNEENITVIGLTHDETWELIDNPEKVLEFSCTVGDAKLKLVIFSEATNDEVDDTFVKMFGRDLSEKQDN